ncbi:hypothetical protein [Phormidium sp. FACHB-1136]
MTIGIIAHEIVQTHELGNPNYASNPVNRCDVSLFWWWASANGGRCLPDY